MLRIGATGSGAAEARSEGARWTGSGELGWVSAVEVLLDAASVLERVLVGRAKPKLQAPLHGSRLNPSSGGRSLPQSTAARLIYTTYVDHPTPRASALFLLKSNGPRWSKLLPKILQTPVCHVRPGASTEERGAAGPRCT